MNTNGSLLQAFVYFPFAVTERGMKEHLEYVKRIEEEVGKASIPSGVRFLLLTQLKYYREWIQLPAVISGAQRHYHH